MATNINIYRGNQIGGCVTVITYSGKTYSGSVRTIRLMVDYGKPLPGSEATEDFKHDWKKVPVNGVLFTHYHGDHIGRFAEIPVGTKLYMGAAARKVMINIQASLAKSKNPDVSEPAAKALSVLNDDCRIVEVKENEPIIFNAAGVNDDSTACNAVTVTGYSIDHSAYDAYMYLIETPDKTILHTGDFRGHGYRGNAIISTIETYVRRVGKRIDILITEGTMMNRDSEKVITERDLQREAAHYFKDHKYVFLICSSTNLDSLASFYHAADRFHMRMYTYSEYICQQLKTFTETAGKRSDLYQFKQVYTLNLEKNLYHKTWDKSVKQKELMREHGFLAVIKPEDFCEKYIDEFLDLEPVIIYSMWDGYLDPGHRAYKAHWDSFLKRQKAKGVEVRHLHTSGHADRETLARVIEAVNPKEAIYPIHTENAAGFYELDICDTLKNKIRNCKQSYIDELTGENIMNHLLDDVRRDAIEKLRSAKDGEISLLLDTVLHIQSLYRLVRREGLLILEFSMQDISSEFFKRPFLLISDGYVPEDVIEISTNEYWIKNPQGIHAMIAYFCIRGALYIQSGDNIDPELVRSLIPPEWHQKYQEQLDADKTRR